MNRKFYLCIDDTDNYDSPGTGALAESIKALLEEGGLAETGYITRHQLFIHEDIPYTSHNSSMCFSGRCNEDNESEIIELAKEYLIHNHAKGSDPGVCVLFYDEFLDFPQVAEKFHEVTEFGYKAKTEVMTKDKAYKLALDFHLHLSEHGGTGQGVIGAIAGIGLRIGGNDGEIKGGIKPYFEKEVNSTKELLNHRLVDEIVDLKGNEITSDESVTFMRHSKTVLKNHRLILLVDRNESHQLVTCSKEQIRHYTYICGEFDYDVEEELVNHGEKTCYNCKYRRWTEQSFNCVQGKNKEVYKNKKAGRK